MDKAKKREYRKRLEAMSPEERKAALQLASLKIARKKLDKASKAKNSA